MKRMLLFVSLSLYAGGEPAYTVFNLVDTETSKTEPRTRAEMKEFLKHGVITTRINGMIARCDRCGEPATHLWIDCEAGCTWSRCDKHKDS